MPNTVTRGGVTSSAKAEVAAGGKDNRRRNPIDRGTVRLLFAFTHRLKQFGRTATLVKRIFWDFTTADIFYCARTVRKLERGKGGPVLNGLIFLRSGGRRHLRIP